MTSADCMYTVHCTLYTVQYWYEVLSNESVSWKRWKIWLPRNSLTAAGKMFIRLLHSSRGGHQKQALYMASQKL